MCQLSLNLPKKAPGKLQELLARSATRTTLISHRLIEEMSGNASTLCYCRAVAGYEAPGEVSLDVLPSLCLPFESLNLAQQLFLLIEARDSLQW